MSLPTSIWGNTYDVYTSVPGPTSTSPGGSNGPVLGNSAILADGSVIQFLQLVGATNPANAALKISVWTTYKVTPTTATNDLCMAVNDLAGGSASNPNSATSGAAVTQNYCAWVKKGGLAFPLVAASVGAEDVLAPSATAGVLETAVAATHFQSNIVNTVVVGGAQAVSPVYIMVG